MNITAMNVKITFQKNDVVIDKIGNHTNKWDCLKTAHCEETSGMIQSTP